MQVTLRPALAGCKEAAFPAKPPPITVTSQTMAGFCPGAGSVLGSNSSMAQVLLSIASE